MSADELRVLAQEQAALRRVATLAAQGAAPEEVFAAVAEEVGQLLAVDFAYMGRYKPEAAVTIIAAWARAGSATPVGSEFMLGGRNLGTMVFETGRTTRFDNLAEASGPVGVAARESGFRSSVGTPILVEGCLWAVMAVGSSLDQGLPAGTESRLVQFTELVATAIANAESRAGLARLAEEQAALRRVATLVVHGASPEDVFAAVYRGGRAAAFGRHRGPGPLRVGWYAHVPRRLGQCSPAISSRQPLEPLAGGRDWSGSAIASRRSAASSNSPAPPAAAPRCALRSQSRATATQRRPERSGVFTRGVDLVTPRFKVP